MYRHVVSLKLTDVSQVCTASIIRAMNFNVTTRLYVPEDSKLHTRRRENLKSHKPLAVYIGLTI
jgi:hypothetical protein